MLLAGFLVMELFVGSWVGEVDSDVTHWVARNRTGTLSGITDVLSNLADTFTVIGAGVGAGVVLFTSRQWRRASVLGVGLPVELAVFLSVTYAVDRPRPFVSPLESVPSTASSPSGHMAAAVVLYGGLAIVAASFVSDAAGRRWLWVWASVIAVGVGISRVYRGLHHPSDVVAGAVLGLGCLAVAVLAARCLPSGGPVGGVRVGGGGSPGEEPGGRGCFAPRCS